MSAGTPREPRPFVGILFKCCQVYARIYLNKAGDAYSGHCPRCAAKVVMRVAPHGSPNRFWTAE